MMALELPIIYLLPTHLTQDELHDLEGRIPSLTYDITEASVILGKISKKERAQFELRRHKVVTEELPTTPPIQQPGAKRRKLNGGEAEVLSDAAPSANGSIVLAQFQQTAASTVKVVKLAWLTDSLAKGAVLPTTDYLLYEGYKLPASSTTSKETPKRTAKGQHILDRATADAGDNPGAKGTSVFRHGYARHPRTADTSPRSKRPPLMKHTTTEEERVQDLPPVPEFLHTTYSCQRPTPVNPPNATFIEILKDIRTTRLLTGDKIGVRAYSTTIAALSAYPYSLTSWQEVARLPGCGTKIAELYLEWRTTGHVVEAEGDKSDPKLKVLKLFYEIWGVGETTAREFYNRGWRDLDDVVEYGWSHLTRVQQIGVKYYDDFLLKIPREEVEHIGNTILEHANKIQNGFRMVIVGGYRRGKKESGDVDVVISHPNEIATDMFVGRLVVSLETDKLITHTLILSTKNSERGQMPVNWRGEKPSGTGFDTLDKALVVWQEPMPKGQGARNTNPHRRVDIIISPWKTAGCAVMGWTSGTTFQRDLRRYCKREKALKFDSSGIRSRVDGSWVDVEDGGLGKASDLLMAEQRVFDSLGLEWRPPEERCTG